MPVIRRNDVDSGILLSLWLADGLFVMIYLALGGLVVLGVMSEIPDILAIGLDWSVSETYNYLKWIVVVILLVGTTAHLRQAWPAWLALVFLVVLADDALLLHERLGPTLAVVLPQGLQDTAVPELLSFALLGSVVVAGVALAYAGAGRDGRRMIVKLLALIAAIAVFAVGVDFVHDTLPLGPIGYRLVVVVEDGGELFLTSLILSFVYRSIWQDRDALR